jgi:hypothetical protein
MLVSCVYGTSMSVCECMWVSWWYLRVGRCMYLYVSFCDCIWVYGRVCIWVVWVNVYVNACECMWIYFYGTVYMSAHECTWVHMSVVEWCECHKLMLVSWDFGTVMIVFECLFVFQCTLV